MCVCLLCSPTQSGDRQGWPCDQQDMTSHLHVPVARDFARSILHPPHGRWPCHLFSCSFCDATRDGLDMCIPEACNTERLQHDNTGKQCQYVLKVFTARVCCLWSCSRQGHGISTAFSAAVYRCLNLRPTSCCCVMLPKYRLSIIILGFLSRQLLNGGDRACSTCASKQATLFTFFRLNAQHAKSRHPGEL